MNESITNCTRIVNELNQAIPDMAILNVYGKLLEAQEKNITVTSEGRMTSGGNLLMGCIYYRYLTGEKVSGLVSYMGVTNEEVAMIVDLANSIEIDEAPK